MINYLAVFIGGGLGAAIRFASNNLFRSMGVNVVFSTLTVNIIGSFILGFAGAYFYLKAPCPAWLKTALTVGFCGGLTTFSTFSSESLSFLTDGKYLEFFSYIILSIAICITCTALGAYFAKVI